MLFTCHKTPASGNKDDRARAPALEDTERRGPRGAAPRLLSRVGGSALLHVWAEGQRGARRGVGGLVVVSCRPKDSTNKITINL